MPKHLGFYTMQEYKKNYTRALENLNFLNHVIILNDIIKDYKKFIEKDMTAIDKITPLRKKLIKGNSQRKKLIGP